MSGNTTAGTATRRGWALLITLLVAATSCSSGGGSEAAEPPGYTRQPVPNVSAVSLPVAGTGKAFPLRAPTRQLRVVFFGFTSCPVECPTTLSDLKRAVQRLPSADRRRVTVGLISVDLQRDSSDRLADYVGRIFTTRVPSGVGLRAADDPALRTAANGLGASYSVTPNADGTPNITHSTEIYAIDDRGRVVRQWPFGTTPSEFAGEFAALLAGQRLT
ncbi:MAG: SCO family protein [Actinomycetes bacterium]